MARRCLLAVVALVVSSGLRAEEKPVDIPVAKLGNGVRLIGKLHDPIGTVVTVQGVVVDGPHKGYEGGPNICVQWINGRATQEHIQIKLDHLFEKFGEHSYFYPTLPILVPGACYEFEGFETDDFIGIPREVFDRTKSVMPQTIIGHVFIHRFTVFRGKRIDPLRWSPADFVDRGMLVPGKAANDGAKAFIVGDGWRVQVNEPWPKYVVGKDVEGVGTIRPTADKAVFRLANGTTRLVQLKDQVGQSVVLRGTAWSSNRNWHLDYRGTVIHVENMSDLPGWQGHLHAEAVEIRGVLEEVMLPEARLADQKDVPRRMQFIVRKPTWKPAGALLGPER